jgi:GT2 family glycosyltransferase
MAIFMENINLTKPKYSVIVLIYHRNGSLVDMAINCIKSVKKYSKDYELIIVDNGSTTCHSWEDECDTYIRLNKNYGISHGWNTGLYNARGQYPVIIGDDVTVCEGWLEAMYEGMQQPDAGMCNPHVEHLPKDEGLYENYKWPSGACFMLSRNTIEKVGYFAEHLYFPAQFEDTDYWTRIYKKGLKIYTNYSVTVGHLEGQTDNAPDIKSGFEANKQRFMKEHGFDPVPIFYGNGIMPVFY